MEEVLRLTEFQLDALKEIGNIGAGNASTALSQMVNKRVEMHVPEVSIMPLQEVPDAVGGPEVEVLGVYLRIHGDAPGNMMLLLPLESARGLIKILTGERPKSRRLTNMHQSALMEVGNILTSAYLNALSNLTELVLLPSIPGLALDMAGAILSVVLIELSMVGDFALIIETQFTSQEESVKGHFFLLPDPGSLEVILKAIGVEQ